MDLHILIFWPLIVIKKNHIGVIKTNIFGKSNYTTLISEKKKRSRRGVKCVEIKKLKVTKPSVHRMYIRRYTILLVSCHQLTDNHYKIGQSLMLHSLKKDMGILTRFSSFMAGSVELEHTIDQPFLLFRSKKKSLTLKNADI